MEEENKKISIDLGNSDTWACKECEVTGDKMVHAATSM
jgi:hypothetical protein